MIALYYWLIKLEGILSVEVVKVSDERLKSTYYRMANIRERNIMIKILRNDLVSNSDLD